MAKKKTGGAPKSVRFTNIVERCGRPRAHTLWLSPDKDPELQRAITANRVMTVQLSATSGKTDQGVVGFEASPGAQILIFPKSLKSFEGARIVGIKFELVEQPKMELARTPAAKVAHTKPKERKPAAVKHAAAEKKDTDAVEKQPAPEPTPPQTEPAPPKQSKARAKSRAHPKPARVEHITTKEAADAPQRVEAADETDKPAKGALVDEVRAAIKELEQGKAVAAYRRLQRAIE
jgi:hypothetical protein